MIYVSVMDVHGGQEVCISFSSDVVDAINWVKDHRSKMESEARLRKDNPALEDSWKQYQLMLQLVTDTI